MMIFFLSKGNSKSERALGGLMVEVEILPSCYVVGRSSKEDDCLPSTEYTKESGLGDIPATLVWFFAIFGHFLKKLLKWSQIFF